MIIQCEKCQTRFRLDDSRVTAKGVKVRCTKCKHVFTVRAEDTDAPSVPSAAVPVYAPPAAPEESPAAASENWSLAAEPTPAPAADSIVFDDAPPESEPTPFSPFASSTFDPSEFSFDSEESVVPAAVSHQTPVAEPVAAGGDVDFSGFDFGDDEEPEPPPQAAPAPAGLSASAAVAPPKAAPQGLDFSDDDMFGAVVQTTPEATPDNITFDFEGDSFAESMDMSSHDATSKSGTLFSLDSHADAPFSLGEIDFGDELTSVAVQQVNPDDLKPSQEILFAPLAAAKVTASDDALTQAFLGEEQQALPPLSIPSRRKQSPLFGVLASVAAVLVIAVLGYFGYSSLSAPKQSDAPVSGKISVRSVKSVFVDNATAGELLVVSGEAFNDYAKPRAALQVMVTVYDAAGQSVSSKSAYGGNPLTEEQIETLPLDKIEAAMANQFGDSLANMEVAPGKSIPFVVVLANLPAGAKDFAVQPAGSTVATGKQQ